MKRALIFLLLFVPILMAMLYLTGDLKRIAKVPSLRIEKKDPSLSEEIVRTEQGYVVRSVGEWALKRYDRESLRLLWSAKGEKADALDERRFAVTRVEAKFFEYEESGKTKWESAVCAGRANVEVHPEGGYIADLSGGVSAEAYIGGEKEKRVQIKTDGVKIRVQTGKEKAGELTTDLPVQIVTGETVIEGKGMNANTLLKRIVLERDIFVKSRTGSKEDVEAEGERLGVQTVEDGYELRLSASAGSVKVLLMSGDESGMPLSMMGDVVRLKMNKKGEIEGAEASGRVVLCRRGEPFMYARSGVYIPTAKRVVLHGAPSVMFVEDENELFANEAVCIIPEGVDGLVKVKFSDEVVAKIRAKTAGGGKTERWVLRTGEADLTIKSERESKKVQPERIDCVGVVELVSPEQKLLLRVNGLQVRLRDGVFEECEGEEFKFESEKMTATGKKIVLTEKGNLLRLIGEVKGELKGTGGKIELECEKVNVRFEEAEYKVVSLEAEEVRRCLVRKEKMENLDVLTESLFYNAVEERLSFGEKDVQLVYGESKFSIKDLKIDMRRMEATGGRVTGVIDSKGLKGDVSAEKTRLSFAEDGLREADFEENVRFDTEGFSLESSRLDFDSPAQEVLIKDVKLASKADALRVAARDCFVFLPLRRVEFEGSPKVSGTRGEKQKWWLEAERMVVVYKETTSSKGRMQIESIDSLYAEKSVKAEIEEEKSTGRLSCEKCVYLKESSKVSIMGAPAVIERGGAVLREKEFVYDLSKGVVESGGKDSGYDWELDPLKLKEKKRKRE